MLYLCLVKSSKSIPRHVAVIMDGNGRWAAAQGKERVEGHVAGVEAIRRTIRAASAAGVEYLTLYAFSTENWARPEPEIDALMELFCLCVIQETPSLKEQNVRARIIGDREHLSEKVRTHFAQMEDETAACTGLTLLIAVNYSAREELTKAARELCEQVEAGRIQPNQIGQTALSDHLYTYGVPDPDLLIRTSGEQRLSNFLLWQAAYAELYFTPVLWPDFGATEFKQALDAYAARNRRYGALTTSL